MNVFQMILAFLNTDPLQNFRVTQPKAAPKADHLLLLLPIISEQKAKGLGGGWKARWPRVIIHYLVSSSSNSSGAKITAEHDKGSRSSRVNMVAEHAISRALYLGSAAPHFPPIVHCAILALTLEVAPHMKNILKLIPCSLKQRLCRTCGLVIGPTPSMSEELMVLLMQ